MVAIGVIGLRFHYFTDTVAGAAVGIGTVCGLALLLDLPAVSWPLAQASRRLPSVLERGSGQRDAEGDKVRSAAPYARTKPAGK